MLMVLVDMGYNVMVLNIGQQEQKLLLDLIMVYLKELDRLDQTELFDD
jgi:hypothetical protein